MAFAPAQSCGEAAEFVPKFRYSFADCDGVSACAAVQVLLAHPGPLGLLTCVQAQHLKRSSGVLQLLLAGSQTRTRTKGECPKLSSLYREDELVNLGVPLLVQRCQLQMTYLCKCWAKGLCGLLQKWIGADLSF